MKSYNLVKLFLSLISFFICIGAFIIFSQSEVSATDIHIVKLQAVMKENSEQLVVDPDVLTIGLKDIVIWVNQAPTDELKISFEEGRKCQDVTSPSNHFNLNASCYVANWLWSDETASLKFNDVGTYKYQVQTRKGIVKDGKIIIVRNQ